MVIFIEVKKGGKVLVSVNMLWMHLPSNGINCVFLLQIILCSILIFFFCSYSEGCPKNCNNRGVCVERDGRWFCSCNSDWHGNDCSIPLEKECGDKKDNDNGKFNGNYKFPNF